jgi:hypothetical protein
MVRQKFDFANHHIRLDPLIVTRMQANSQFRQTRLLPGFALEDIVHDRPLNK